MTSTNNCDYCGLPERSIGYAVVRYNQVGSQPEVIEDYLHDHIETAVDRCRLEEEAMGARRDRYRVVSLDLMHICELEGCSS